MNSGKSDTLIKTAYNYTEKGLAIATIKPAVDTKAGELIAARAGGTWEVNILATAEMDLQQEVRSFIAREALKKLNVVLVDEAQFLRTEQIDQLQHIAKADQISVIAYGLSTDFQTHLFEGSKRLFELADDIKEIETMCWCGSKAKFNCRKIDDVYVFDGDQVAIDGEQAVTYDSLCPDCYLTEKAKALAA